MADKKEKKTYTEADVADLQQAIETKNKVAVREMLEGKILKAVPEADKESVYLGIFQFHDTDLTEYVVKNEKKLDVHFLKDISDYKDQLFLQEFFEDNASKISVKDEDRERILELAILCNSPEMVAKLTRKPQDSDYPKLAAASEDIFDLLLKVKTKNISADTKRAVAIAALMADDGTDRIEVLENHGWDFDNPALKEDVEKTLSEKKYTNDKEGRLQRTEDDARQRFMEKRASMNKAELKKEDKSNKRDARMSMKELLTGKEKEKTYTQIQQEKKKAQKLAREKKRREAQKTPAEREAEAKRAAKKQARAEAKEARKAAREATKK